MLAGMLNVSIPWLLTGEGEGIDAPMDAAEDSRELRAVLVELRELRVAQQAISERSGRLEKRLRRMLEAM
jgi:hypothetical protein